MTDFEGPSAITQKLFSSHPVTCLYASLLFDLPLPTESLSASGKRAHWLSYDRSEYLSTVSPYPRR